MREEPPGHTFLLRIWIEETKAEIGHVHWRGHITHLPDEQRRYVETFAQVGEFIRQQIGDTDCQGGIDTAVPHDGSS